MPEELKLVNRLIQFFRGKAHNHFLTLSYGLKAANYTLVKLIVNSASYGAVARVFLLGTRLLSPDPPPL